MLPTVGRGCGRRSSSGRCSRLALVAAAVIDPRIEGLVTDVGNDSSAIHAADAGPLSGRRRRLTVSRCGDGHRWRCPSAGQLLLLSAQLHANLMQFHFLFQRL